MPQRAPRCVVIGVGNTERGDDAAGRAVARRLACSRHLAEIIEHDGEATALLDAFAGATHAYLIDACSSGVAPGTLRRFDVVAAPLPQSQFGYSTHGFGLAAAIELARALKRLPPACVVYAVEGAGFEVGAPLSPAVEAGVAEAARRIAAEITDIGRNEGQ